MQYNIHELTTGVTQFYFVSIVKTKVDKVTSYGKRQERCEIHGDNFIKHKGSL